mmetsp:Transcript_5913/g.9437  ORF Transcript_5913/g.9437 Transcript_5913/m.9437 type:complete len:219 (+) Transcript_5913:77-733(+)
MPSRVMKVRANRATYGGVSIAYSLLRSLRAMAMAPNREVPAWSDVSFLATTSANSAASHSCKLFAPETGSRTNFINGVGVNLASCIDCTRAGQSEFRTLLMPAAKLSITPKSMRSIKPKSRNTTRPSSPIRRFPSWGSAWTKPVTRSCTTQASTAISTRRRRSWRGSSDGARLGYHSRQSTRAEPSGPVNSGTHAGELTNGRNACRVANSKQFAASSW